MTSGEFLGQLPPAEHLRTLIDGFMRTSTNHPKIGKITEPSRRQVRDPLPFPEGTFGDLDLDFNPGNTGSLKKEISTFLYIQQRQGPERDLEAAKQQKDEGTVEVIGSAMLTHEVAYGYYEDDGRGEELWKSVTRRLTGASYEVALHLEGSFRIYVARRPFYCREETRVDDETIKSDSESHPPLEDHEIRRINDYLIENLVELGTPEVLTMPPDFA